MITQKILLSAKSIKQIHGKFPDRQYSLCTDSRTYKAGDVFVALKGENFDAFKFLDELAQRNCPLAIYNHTQENSLHVSDLSNKFPDTAFIGVSDTLQYLQEISYEHVKEWHSKNPRRKIIGITGSNGKTTHKEMLFHFLNSIAPNKVVATQGNLNNHIGVPLTLMSINENHDYAIVEMGMNHVGEISLLTSLALPNCGLITNIGSAHIEFMGSEENIFNEKSVLYHSVIKNAQGSGLFVVCADDPFLACLPRTKGLITFGENEGEIKVRLKTQQITLCYLSNEINLRNEHIVGAHNFKNLACTFILANALIPGHEKELEKAASTFTPKKNRASWVQFENQNYFLDAYNANPSSMKASLSAFVENLAQKKVPLNTALFVLGDMNELGSHAERLHKEIGEFLSQLGAEHVVFIGRYNHFYRQGFLRESFYFDKREDFYPKWKELRQKFPYIFLKASRSLQLESLMDIK